jgi:hypothetical protein
VGPDAQEGTCRGAAINFAKVEAISGLSLIFLGIKIYSNSIMDKAAIGFS